MFLANCCMKGIVEAWKAERGILHGVEVHRNLPWARGGVLLDYPWKTHKLFGTTFSGSGVKIKKILILLLESRRRSAQMS